VTGLLLPSSVTRAREALARANLVGPSDDDNGARLRGLAATRLGGIMLVSGDEGFDLAAWMIDGLDITSRLVVHHEGGIEPSLVSQCFNNDLRVTTHVQPFGDFLDDVSHHRFSMLVLAAPELEASLFTTAASMMDDGGILVCAGSLAQKSNSFSEPDGFCHMHTSPDQRILVRRHAGNRPQRRGGRRRTRD